MMVDYFIGFLCGSVVFLLIHFFSVEAYKNILILKAGDGSCEKLGNGFYRIVPEKEMVELELMRLRLEMMPKEE